MPWYPGAIRRPITGHTNGRMRSYRGIVLHCNDADSTSLYDWIMRPGSNMSCHFQVFKDGTVEQYLDTDYSSWCQGDGNDDWLSLETSGKAGAPLTDAQMAAIGPLLAWAAKTHGFSLQLADTPAGRGLGWHGMGAASGDPGWGHALCPGVRKDQRPALLALAADDPTTTIMKDWFDMATAEDLERVIIAALGSGAMNAAVTKGTTEALQGATGAKAVGDAVWGRQIKVAGRGPDGGDAVDTAASYLANGRFLAGDARNAAVDAGKAARAIDVPTNADGTVDPAALAAALTAHAPEFAAELAKHLTLTATVSGS